MRRLVIVPARGGSKRLSGKNVRLLGGKPLISHTIEVVRECFEKVIVSSDCEAILSAVEDASNVERSLRPSELSTDTSKVISTVNHYFSQYNEKVYDQIWLCLPTCPLRTFSDVVAGQTALSEEVDGVISITEFDFPPSLALRIDQGLLNETDSSRPFANGNSRSQDHFGAYRPNGAFYGMWWTSFDRLRNFFRGKVRGYVMPRENSVDIDTEFDLAMAEAVLNRIHLRNSYQE